MERTELMKLRTVKNNNVPVIRCSGSMTTEIAALILKNAIYNFPSYDSIVINLAKVDNIGHDALMVIRDVIADGYGITLAEPKPAVHIIAKTNLTVPIYNREETAIAEILSLQAV